jgi:hypothetical protein
VILRTGKYRFNRTAPLIFSPAAPHTLYLGSNVLFKTSDAGHSWQIISPDLTREDPGVPANIGNLIADDPAQGKHRGVIYSLAPSPLDANLIWAGTDDGLLWLTRDGGQNWREVSPPGLTAWSKIAQLDASHFDPNSVYAAVNRFRLDDLHPYIYRTHDGGQTWQKITNGLPDDASVNVVREDPVRQGLLFAGTERAVYVSFNDGDSWQSLQLNLPATSMRDLVVHGDDIVVGTHGRSFWILDDITPLRQVTEQTAAAPAFLFRPGVAYRVRRNVNTDTPLPPEEPAGKNPPNGAILDYSLQAAVPAPVKLQILDANGKIVRSFSSTDKPEATLEQLGRELNVPLYWIRPPEILSAAAGAHRLVWDLHTAPPATLRHEYPISAIVRDTPRLPVGPAVMPGMYTVKLEVAGQTYNQPLEIKMDPRITAPVDQLDQQFRLASRICEAMNASFASLGQVRAVRAQLRDLEHQAPKGEAADAIRALEQKVTPLEGAAAGFGQSGHQDSFAQLNGQFGQMLGIVDGADAAPTQTAQDTTGDLQRALSALQNQWDDIKARDISALDDQLRRANLPIINLAATLEPEQETAGDDEP